MIEGGDDALAQARALVAQAPRAAVLLRSQVHLKAPVQPPPQMRDCLCYEEHLRQSFAAARQLRAARTPDPAATLAAMNGRLNLMPPGSARTVRWNADDRHAVVCLLKPGA